MVQPGEPLEMMGKWVPDRPDLVPGPDLLGPRFGPLLRHPYIQYGPLQSRQGPLYWAHMAKKGAQNGSPKRSKQPISGFWRIWVPKSGFWTPFGAPGELLGALLARMAPFNVLPVGEWARGPYLEGPVLDSSRKGPQK